MYEINKQKFGAFVSKLRKEKGYTQKELANRLFVSDKAVSKWETAVSIPDTALLVPLAELLGVTVTELLMCEPMEQGGTMDAGQVEHLVKSAITYGEEDSRRAWQVKNRWGWIYGLSLMTGGLGLLLNLRWERLTEACTTLVALGALFGAYFCFFVKLKLPKYYDENRISTFQDGPVRMNIPGTAFHNGNWPHIIKAGRIWACTSMALVPAADFLMNWLFPGIWGRTGSCALFAAVLGGLFVLLYQAGKKETKTGSGSLPDRESS